MHLLVLEVTFNIDANGLLTVTALDLATKKSQSVTITNSKGRWGCLNLSVVVFQIIVIV